MQENATKLSSEPLFTLELTKDELSAVFASVGMAAATANSIPSGHDYYESAQAELVHLAGILAKAINSKAQHPEAFEPTVVLAS